MKRTRKRLILSLAAIALLGAAQARAARVRSDTYTVSLGAAATTATATANFAGFAKRAYVTSANLGTTCTLALKTADGGVNLFSSDALSTGTTAVSLSDLPVSGRTQWLVTAGAAPGTTQSVSILLYYDANE